jgi:hypothetical protein
MEKVNRLKKTQPLRVIVFLDEADSTYTSMTKSFPELYRRLNEPDIQKVFVSATFDKIIELQECKDSVIWAEDLMEKAPSPYRAAHHPESIVHIKTYPPKTNHNQFVMNVIEEHPDYFTSPIEKGGYRKVIALSNNKNMDMISLSDFLLNHGFLHTLIVNQNGLQLYKKNAISQTFRALKGEQFNKFLWRIVMTHGLTNGPLAIIGFMKVDRGVTFHYAPQDGKDAVIWTDLILGEVLDESSAVQRAGRLAGHIAHCDNYVPGTYWTDQDTWNKIILHNRGIDRMQGNDPSARFGEAYVQARKEVMLEHQDSVSKTSNRVPMVITVDHSVIQSLKKQPNTNVGLENKAQIIRREFKSQTYNEEFMDVLNHEHCLTIICPSTKKTYEQHIEVPVNHAANNNRSLAPHYRESHHSVKYKNVSCWEAYIDDKSNRIVVIWQVSLTKQDLLLRNNTYDDGKQNSPCKRSKIDS